jgi:cellulose synthase (UDP-forming)
MVKGEWQTTVSPELADTVKGVGLGWIWSAYNLVLIGIALLILLDVPKPDLYEWFNLRRTVRVVVNGREYWGNSLMLSEGGAEIALTQMGLEQASTDDLPATLTILETNLTLEGQIVKITEDPADGSPIIRILFDPMTLAQEQALVEKLFCRPGQWQYRDTPGEVHSVLILLRTLFAPRVLFDRDVEVRAIPLSQG